MRRAVKRRSNAARQPARSRRAQAATAATAASMEETMKPLTPFSITSGTDPHGQAIVGVPHAMASIITTPNGSGQSMGNRWAMAPPRNAALSASPISPTHSTSGSPSSGRTT